MGYCIEKEEGFIIFKKENADKIVKALEGKRFRWCDYFSYEDFENNEIDIYDVFEGLRYELEGYDHHFKIVGFYGEKYGNDDEIFKLIAPYCEDGYLQFVGEDGEHFRFIIKDGKFKEVYAELKWD